MWGVKYTLRPEDLSTEGNVLKKEKKKRAEAKRSKLVRLGVYGATVREKDHLVKKCIAWTKGYYRRL